MKIDCPPGLRTDAPPISSEVFWYYGKNVRFQAGRPETIGLFGAVLNAVDDPLTVTLAPGELVSVYEDKQTLIVGYGDSLTAIQYPGGTSRTITLAGTGGSGRWWFDSDEETIYFGRSNFSGAVFAMPRSEIFNFANLTPAVVLPNAPVGCKAGGIYASIMILAGTTGAAGAGPKLVVRWSARTTDEPTLPPFGFERWTPDAETASGEYPLENGSEIVGGGKTDFGFVVWTDTTMYLMTPRTDLSIFTFTPVASRGLMASDTWAEVDGRLWWYDQTRTLNVFDGGQARQVFNPMRHVSVELIAESKLDQCYVSSDLVNTEIILHYPDEDGYFHELVFNSSDGVFYAFSLDRVAMTSSHGERPSFGVRRDGGLFFYDLRETVPLDLLSSDMIPSGLPAPMAVEYAGIGPPVPFDFFLMTNFMVTEDPVLTSLRVRNVHAPHSVHSAPGSSPLNILRLFTESLGDLSINVSRLADYDDNSIGDGLFQLRSGGKAMRFGIAGESMTNKLVFSHMDVEMNGAGER